MREDIVSQVHDFTDRASSLSSLATCTQYQVIIGRKETRRLQSKEFSLEIFLTKFSAPPPFPRATVEYCGLGWGEGGKFIKFRLVYIPNIRHLLNPEHL